MLDRGRWYEGDSLEIWLIAWLLVAILYLTAHLRPLPPDAVTVPGYAPRTAPTMVRPTPPLDSSGGSFIFRVVSGYGD